MKALKQLIAAAAIAASLTPLSVSAQDGEPANSMRELLDLVEQGLARDASEFRSRMQAFKDERQKQEARLSEARRRLEQLEARSTQLEEKFQSNETELSEAQARLDERLGTLRELFGVLQQVAGDTRGVFRSSMITSQYPSRDDFLDDLIQKAGSSSELPEMAELERLWFEMQREMAESAKVTRYTAQVTGPDGNKSETEVVRVGSFNIMKNAAYLDWEADTQQLVELPRQPSGRYLSSVDSFVHAGGDDVAPLYVDPSRGSILGLLIQTPDLAERVDQGGVVGYVIIALGVFALLIAIWRLIALSLVSMKVRAQLGSDQPSEGNPLGRIMGTYRKYENTDNETLELKLGEAIANETPRLQRFLAVLKIIAVVAPLLGLLGTVTGMINTFQVITLFGTGDPKLMAGGISQALVTTVLGLCVAVPTVLLHTFVQGRAKSVTQILQKRSIGIIAEHSERGHGHVSAA
ncbi:MotA/TolQ/ExbB proton channel family protein [Algiphilus sp.]|uniref:MotA/TolQ/ExbB proton channel family protein n=1 Tax=Algiphilus sp. TaxID=1872431 RepID=UPI003C5CBFD7